jgi:hypothetical protein
MRYELKNIRERFTKKGRMCQLWEVFNEPLFQAVLIIYFEKT